MANDPQVTVDGVDPGPARPGPGSPFAMLLVGLVVGVALGAILLGPLGGRQSTDTTASTAGLGGGTPSAGPDVGISEAIPGFPDGLVAVATGETDSFEHLLWPRSGPVIERPMRGGDAASFDASSQYVAVTEALPDLAGQLLSVGRYNAVEPVATGVTSFAWHDSRPGTIAFTTEHDGTWQLWAVDPDRVAEQVEVADVAGGTVAAWGDWGWAIQTGEGVVLLNSDGLLRDIHPGVALTSQPEGWILVSGDSLQMVSAGGGVRGLGVGTTGLGPLTAAEFSPSGELVAVQSWGHTLVLSVSDVDGNPLTEFGLFGPAGLAWSSDDRYLLAPGGRGVVVIDVEVNSIGTILDTHTVVATSTVPSSNS